MRYGPYLVVNGQHKRRLRGKKPDMLFYAGGFAETESSLVFAIELEVDDHSS